MDIKTFLKQYKNKQIFYKTNPGNGGDSLIAVGAFDLMESLDINYKIIENPTHEAIDNEIVFYAGGGNLVHEYHQCADFLQEYKSKCKEIILLPHTIRGNKNLLESLGENITIFCREKYSFNYLKSLQLKCNVFIDHDLATHINLDRLMVDSTEMPFGIYKTIIKRKLRTRTFKFRTLNAYRNDVEKTDIIIPHDNIDLSNEINYQYKMSDPNQVRRTAADIFKTLKYFSTINTNRLHIAIAGGMLNKKVNLFSNSYWKNKAMFEYSINPKLPSVKFHDK